MSMTKGGEVSTNETLPRAALEATPSPPCPDDPTSLTEIFGRFLRLYVAEGDASPATIRTYYAQATQYVAWCQQQGVSPSTAAENDIIAYRKYLVETGYKPTTIALKLAVVRRLYEAIRWWGLRNDNPAAGIKAPRDRTNREERV
jgi:site-specific recombinase XerD